MLAASCLSVKALRSATFSAASRELVDFASTWVLRLCGDWRTNQLRLSLSVYLGSELQAVKATAIADNRNASSGKEWLPRIGVKLIFIGPPPRGNQFEAEASHTKDMALVFGAFLIFIGP